jgi:benzoyl-CoA reductase/2-hydroxyglutaryl-CoA dehydratase subunit BcrC/BadD/HgdB
MEITIENIKDIVDKAKNNLKDAIEKIKLLSFDNKAQRQSDLEDIKNKIQCLFDESDIVLKNLEDVKVMNENSK